MGGINAGCKLWVLGLLLAVAARPAAAVYLDEEQNISLHARIYSQASIRLEDSQGDTRPPVKTGQLTEHRNFYNPEIDAKLTSYIGFLKTSPLSWLAPDDLTFRLAAWGFYDGIYDYGSAQFGRSARLVNSTFGDLATPPTHAWFLEGPEFRAIRNGALGQMFPGVQVQNPRDIYASRQRINELYLSYTKGPAFVRFGRQAISWGESDTIAILDQNNPFDVTLSAPGIFQDLDEARIPLWTLRGSLNLFDSLGPLSSGFIEAYWVPGELDNNTGILPIYTASPFSIAGEDPQNTVTSIAGPLLPVQFVLLDHVPKKNFHSSRWGVRVQSVVGREHTVSAWYYTHFPNAPVPLSHGVIPTDAGRQLFVTETIHALTGVVGVADTFFLEPLDGIVRLEAEYFINEPGFIPQRNLGVSQASIANPLLVLRGCTASANNPNPCTVPKANVLRWETGFDRFFFLRALNPTNSFIFSTAVVGSWNLDETSHKDFRYQGERKAGSLGTNPDDFVQQKAVEAFGQIHFQTDYLHGRLAPAITYIQNRRGSYAILPSAIYRWTDALLFTLNFVEIGGEFEGFGFFRDRRQVSLRATYQLN